MEQMKTFTSIQPDRLQALIDAFARARIAVVGDFFLDKYLDVDPAAAESSVETGKTAHQVAAVRHCPGAAGTVVANLAALGAGALTAIGLTGDDGEAYELRRGLDALRCDTEHLHCDPGRMTPTYLKPRDIDTPDLTGEHSRYDTKNRTPSCDATQRRIVRSLDAVLGRVDAVIVADQVEQQDCGVVTRSVREALADRARRHGEVTFWADSRRRIRQFRNVIIKPNQFEAVGRDNPPPGDEVGLARLCEALLQLRVVIGAPICATRGDKGMIVTDPEMTLVPAVRVAGPIDPTGAGDSATAAVVLALACGATLPEAAAVGNLAASITVEQLATTGTARGDQLPERLELWRQQHAAG